MIYLKNKHDSLENGGEMPYMDPEARQYILHRFKTMSYFSNCVPYEYSSHMIKADMERAAISDIPSEDEIDQVIESAKSKARDIILGMLASGKKVGSIREWCEFSLECPVPILPVSSVSINSLLVRYDYFNYEINRILREEQISIAMAERKKEGILFDASRLGYEFDDRGITNLSDDFTRVDLMTVEEISEAINDAEVISDDIIRSYIYDDPDSNEVLEKSRNDRNIVYSEEELVSVISDVTKKERFRILSREIARMGTSEMWNLINTVEAFRMYSLSKKFEFNPFDESSPDNKMLEMMKTYAESRDDLREGYLFQASRLNPTDLSQLTRLIQGYITWKGLFHFLPPGHTFSSGSDLSRSIVEGFSQEHGMDPDLFGMFLLGSS